MGRMWEIVEWGQVESSRDPVVTIVTVISKHSLLDIILQEFFQIEMEKNCFSK